jgi:hypothetical protein
MCNVYLINIQGVPLNRALYFMGVANSESRFGGAPITNRWPQGGEESMEILVLGLSAP